MSARRNARVRAQRHQRNQWVSRAVKQAEGNSVEVGSTLSSRHGAGLMRGGFRPNILVSRRRAERPRKDYSLDGLKVAELRDLASRRGMKGFINMKKPALIKAIEGDRF